MLQTWFEAKLRYTKVNENGGESKTTEVFLLDAVSFTDAESRMIKQAQQMVKGGEFEVKDIKQSNVGEVFYYGNGQWWWKCKISMVNIDEASGREKRMATHCVIMADTIKEAVERLAESLSYVLVPYEVLGVVQSSICDVFQYDIDAAAAEMQKNN